MSRQRRLSLAERHEQAAQLLIAERAWLCGFLRWLRDRLGDLTMAVAWRVERIERARGRRA